MPRPDEFERRDEIEKWVREALRAIGRGALKEGLLHKKALFLTLVELGMRRQLVLDVAIEVYYDKLRARDQDFSLLKNNLKDTEFEEVGGRAKARYDLLQSTGPGCGE